MASLVCIMCMRLYAAKCVGVWVCEILHVGATGRSLYAVG